MTHSCGIWVGLIFTLLMLLFPCGLRASVDREVVQKIKQGDDAFVTREKPEKALEALALYRQVVAETNQQDPQALSRQAMGCYFVGLRQTPLKVEREKIFWEGQEAGKQSVKLDPQCAACKFWTAINMALYGDSVGVFKMLFSLQEIQTLLKESLRLDPGYAHAGAYRLLGLIQQKLPGILGGSNQQALEYFKQAIAQAPDEPLNYLFMARLLRDEMKKNEAAQLIAEEGLAIRDLSADRLESIEAQGDLKKLLREMGSP